MQQHGEYGGLPGRAQQAPAGYRGDEISPVPPAAGPTFAASPQPFMHYEDFEFLESPKNDGAPEIIQGGNTKTKVKTRSTWGSRIRSEKSSALSKTTVATGPKLPLLGSRLVWLSEIIWCAVSIGCMLALVIILRHYDQQPLPHWPLGITLNTLVAFLSTLARAAFVVPVMEGLSQLKWNWLSRRDRSLEDFQAFDAASRGPYGSLKLLFTTKGRFLGTAASIVLVTGLVTSPLTQAVIAYPTRLQPGGGVATAMRGEQYFFEDILATATVDLDPRQKQAIQRGLFNPPSDPVAPLAPICSSGSCNWPPFNSLGICVKIADITNLLTTRGPFPASNTSVNTGLPPRILVSQATLPNGMTLVGGAQTINMNISSPVHIKPGGFFTNPTYANAAEQTLAFKNEPDLVAASAADLFFIYTNQTQSFSSDTASFRAAEVLIHFCVNSYELSMVGGQPVTRQTASLTRVVTKNGTVADRNEELILAAPGAADGRTYSVNTQNYVAMLNNYIVKTWSGTHSESNGIAIQGATATTDAYGTSMYTGTGRRAPVDENQRAIILNITQNVAISLTNTVRSLGVPLEGEVLQVQTFVQVQWQWLSCLILQVSLTTIFLFVVIVQTSYLGVKVLKSSAVATLMAIPSDEKAWLEQQGLGQIQDGRSPTQNMSDVQGRFGVEADGGTWTIRLRR